MSNPILDLLGDVGYAMDTPGAYLRGALAGKVGERASGEDMLNSWGVDAGPLGGMAAEVVADPLAIAGLAGGAYKGIQGFTRGARSLAGADDVNPVVKALARFVGGETAAFQPFREIGRRTDPDFVNAKDWFHGTATPGLTPQSLDPMKTDPKALFGRGIYKTDDPLVAATYADTRARDEWLKMVDEGNVIGMQGPDPVSYAASTNHGKILDVERPLSETPGVGDSLVGMAEALAARTGTNGGLARMKHWASGGSPEVSAERMIQEALSFRNRADGLIPGGIAGDPMIEALRGQGYDAITHTGGLRMGIPDALGDPTHHQVLISLDPNDTISKVGRAGQITRFEPQMIEDLLRQIRGG